MIGALIGAGLSVASSIAGNIAARKQRRKAEKKIEEQLEDNQRWRDRNYYQDPTKRGDTMRLMSQLRETLRERSKAARGRQAVMGGTEHSVEAVREANNKTLADVTGNVVAANEARKDRVDEVAEQNKRLLKGQQAGMAIQDAANTAQTVQQIGGVAAHIANGLDSTGGSDSGLSKKDLQGITNQGEDDAAKLEKILNKTYQ
jgi:hypothetical protein